MSYVLVIAGGTSPEREVSLRSGHAVRAALQASGHTVTMYDPKGGNLAAAVQNQDIAFPVLHGIGGEDGQIQEQLERAGIPYVGSGIAASRLCFNKAQYKQFLRAHNIPTPNFVLVRTLEELRNSSLSSSPFVLKPFNGGSSIDVFIVRDTKKADLTAMETTLGHYPGMLLEELVEGVEATVAVLNTQALPVVEIIPPVSGEFDYENKYNGASQELCPPRHVSESAQQSARQLAAQIHELCGCIDFSRTDMIIRGDGAVMVLETNTIPGMTAESLLPKAALTAGVSMNQLCDRLVQMALSRQTARA